MEDKHKAGEISDIIRDRLAALGAEQGADRIVLFGSRARGDHRERSDIDIAVFGLANEKRAAFSEAVEELPTLLDFDVVFVTEKTDAALLHNIEKDGITIMDKTTERLRKFNCAVTRLEEAIAEYGQVRVSSSRDGVIQRFEFCVELAWKTLRDFLLEQGYADINSPKAVLKTAYADGLIDDESGWLELLNARNLTSHVYDEATAEEIFSAIQTKYAGLFKKLTVKLSD